MIVTILPGSSTFHAVDYNEQKVEKGDASVLELHNITGIENFGAYTTEELRNFFIDYSARNDRITKAQFHIAISCRGHEYTNHQLLNFAHQYLDRMGYNAEGQPWIVYAHHDTENTHIHIITSRVAPDGHKIDHNHERRRSQQVINELMNINPEHELSKAITTAYEYRVDGIGQFAAVMMSLGYETKSNGDGYTYIYRDGILQKRLDTEQLKSRLHLLELKEPGAVRTTKDKRKKQLRAVFKKYQQVCGDKEEFRQAIKKRFGADIVYYGSKDTPYGYAVVDHQNKIVFNGRAIMPIKQLLSFPSVEDRITMVNAFIKTTVGTTPGITIRELNRKIEMRFPGCRLSDDKFFVGKAHAGIMLDAATSQQLRANDVWHSGTPSERSATTVGGIGGKRPADSFTFSTPQFTMSESNDGSHYSNREWEVGNSVDPDDSDRQISTKM